MVNRITQTIHKIKKKKKKDLNAAKNPSGQESDRLHLPSFTKPPYTNPSVLLEVMRPALTPLQDTCQGSNGAPLGLPLPWTYADNTTQSFFFALVVQRLGGMGAAP